MRTPVTLDAPELAIPERLVYNGLSHPTLLRDPCLIMNRAGAIMGEGRGLSGLVLGLGCQVCKSTIVQKSRIPCTLLLDLS